MRWGKRKTHGRGSRKRSELPKHVKWKGEEEEAESAEAARISKAWNKRGKVKSKIREEEGGEGERGVNPNFVGDRSKRRQTVKNEGRKENRRERKGLQNIWNMKYENEK